MPIVLLQNVLLECRLTEIQDRSRAAAFGEFLHRRPHAVAARTFKNMLQMSQVLGALADDRK